MSDQEKRILQNTYQSIFINAISDIIQRMNNSDHEEAFECLQNLYAWLPNICITECKEENQQIIRKLNQITSARTIGFSQATIIENHQRKHYLYNANRKLVELFKTSLDKHGYLEISKGRPPTRETTMGDLQKIVDIAKHRKQKEQEAKANKQEEQTNATTS